MAREDETIARIAQTLRERRSALGLTQEELADRLGLTRAYLSQLETGEAATQLRRLVETLNALGLDLVALPREHAAVREVRARTLVPASRLPGRDDADRLRDVLVRLDTTRIDNPAIAARLHALQSLAAHSNNPLLEDRQVRELLRPLSDLADQDVALEVAPEALRRLLVTLRDVFPSTARRRSAGLLERREDVQ